MNGFLARARMAESVRNVPDAGQEAATDDALNHVRAKPT
jgi:hypothetical protein